MSDEIAASAVRLGSLRDVALIDALERIDPASVNGEFDLNALVSSIEPTALGADDFRRLLAAVERVTDAVPRLDLAAVDAGTFVRLIAATSGEQLEAALAVPALRARLLDEIFRRMESHVRQERIKGMHAVIRWRLTGGTGEGGFDRYECTLSNGTCTVNRAMSGRPRVTITITPVDFVRVITHQATPPVLFVTGKIKVTGDLGFAAGLISYFDLPRP